MIAYSFFFFTGREATSFTPSHELLNFVWTQFLSTEGVTEMGATESGFRIHCLKEDSFSLNGSLCALLFKWELSVAVATLFGWEKRELSRLAV